MSGRIVLYFVLLIAVLTAFVLLLRVQLEVQTDDTLIVQKEGVIKEKLQMTALSWAIFDPSTGKIFDAKNPDEVRSIASLTKLYTAYAALNSNDIDTELIINWGDIVTEGRSGKLTYGERMSPRELLFPLLIESSNDAGEAIKRGLGDEFFITISLLHSALDLVHTEIVDGSGLSHKNISTAREFAVFYSHIYNMYPHILDITKLPLYVGETTGYVNNNPGRAFEEFSGGKNGYTTEARRTFIGTFEIQDGKDIGIVFLGSEDSMRDLEIAVPYLKKNYK